MACIGAGNTAIDVVTAARRLGAEIVYLIYRRSEREMSAFRYEYELAKKWRDEGDSDAVERLVA